MWWVLKFVLGGLKGVKVNMAWSMMSCKNLCWTMRAMGIIFFFYNFYSSGTLACHLYERGILYTGTIIETRRDFPASLKGGKERAKKNPGGGGGAMRWERDPLSLLCNG